MKNYGQVISKLRKQKGLTQEQLGKKLNVSFQAVSKWENNQSEPNLETIEKLADVFGITIAQFFEMANIDEGDSATKNLESTDSKNNDINIENNNGGAQGSTKGNAFVQNLKKYKEWYLMIGLAIVILALVLGAFVRPTKYSSSKIYQMVDPAVFCITAQGPDVQRAGSGFFINDSGLAVTNYHVIEGCTSGRVQLNDGKTYDIELVVGCDRNRDIAILQIDIGKSNSVKLGNSDKIEVGDIVYAIGYPESFQLGSASSTFTQGIISKVSFTYEGNSYIQTTVDMTHGNSGGVLINEKGRIIGITTGMLTDGNVDYMNLAIPINKLEGVKRDINVPMDEYYEQVKERTFYYYSDGDIYNTVSYVVGDLISPIEPSKVGYQFDGWYTDETFQTRFDFSQPVTDNNACYAHWLANTYTISFDGSGGQGSMDSIVARYDQAVALPNNAFTFEHYNFIGWSIDGSEVLYTQNQAVKNLTSENNGEVILKAVWDVESITIHFDINGGDGGEMADFKLGFFDTKALPLNSFTKEGYAFAGWLYNGVVYQDGQEVSALADEEVTITFIAQWQPVKYKVVFSFLEETYSQEMTYDESATLLANQFEHIGHHFSYWYDEEGNHYYDCQEVINLISEPTEIVLYAQFDRNTYYIRYNPQIDGVEPIMEAHLYRDTFELMHCPYGKRGYSFEGWQDSEGKLLEDLYYTNLAIEQDAVVDLYAVWEEYEYTLCYLGFNNEILAEENHKYFDYVTIKGDFGLAKEGYIFDGWRFYDTSAEEYVYLPENAVLNEIPRPYFVGILKVSSVWKSIEYTISFNGNGADSGTMSDITCKYDSEITLPANTFIRSGYIFAHWEYYDKSFVDEGTVLNLTSTNGEVITLTAVWVKPLTGEGTEENPYTISTKDEFISFTLLSRYVGYEDGQYFSLETNIDLENARIWSVFSFNGIFEGNDYSISNFTLKGDGTTVALFNVNDGIIRNLTLNNVTIDDNAFKAALLVGDNNGEVEGCKASGSITISCGDESFIGGLVAYNYNSVSYCFADVDIIVNSDGERVVVGGLLGRNDANVYNCYVTSYIEFLDIQDDYIMVGGFAGTMQDGSISYSYAISELNLTSTDERIGLIYLGGFIGAGSDGRTTYLNNCFVKVEMNINIKNFTKEWYDSCPVSNFNGLYYTVFNQTRQEKDFVSDSSTFNVIVNGQPFTVEQAATVTEDANLKDQTWIEENMFNIVGGWKYEGDYPVLDSSSQTFEVNTLEDFLSLNNKTIFADVKLNCNIDLSGQKIIILNNYATFDGNGFTISNLTITSGLRDIYSLFNENYGTIKNLRLSNVNVNVEAEDDVYVGSLVGNNYGTIANVAVYGNVNAYCLDTGYTGGVCAYNYGTIKNCYADVSVTITASYMAYGGGIAGYNGGTITNTFILGEISTTNLRDGYVNCYSSGIASGHTGSTIKNCISFANISVTSECNYLGISVIGVGDFTKENCSGYLQQKLTVNGEESFNTGGKTRNELISKAYLSGLGFIEFVSEENLSNNPDAVWVIDEVNAPLLWFDVQGERE